MNAAQERHNQENRSREDKYRRELDELSTRMNEKIDEVNAAHECTRIAKDAEIRKLHTKIETC